jgi:hypothetical protein
MILIFHYFRKKPVKMGAAYLCLSILGVLLTSLWVAVKYGPQITGGDLAYFEALASGDLLKRLIFGNGNHLSLQGIWFQTRSMMSLAIILLMEKYKGPIQIHLPRALGYWFYPVHIAILTIIKLRIVV